MTAIAVASTWLAGRIEEKEREVAWMEGLYADLRDGTANWREWNDELTCMDRQGVAAEECGMALDQCRRELAALRAQAATGGQR